MANPTYNTPKDPCKKCKNTTKYQDTSECTFCFKRKQIQGDPTLIERRRRIEDHMHKDDPFWEKQTND